MPPVYVCHQGTPCTPPVVDGGITFCPHPDDPDLFVAEVTEEQAADLCRVPAFTRFGGDLKRLPPMFPGGPPVAGARSEPTRGSLPTVYSRPPSQWKNDALLARVKETWDQDAVQAKADEMGIGKPEDADRISLIALVHAGKPQE